MAKNGREMDIYGQSQILGIMLYGHRGWAKKDSDIFKSGGNILGQSASERENKLFFSKFPPFNGNLIINNLF